MSDLALELLCVLLLATAIGWLIGRFLCKNREYLERSQKQNLAKKLEALTTEHEQQYARLRKLNDELNQSKTRNTELMQEKENLEIQVSSLRGEQIKLLENLQTLEVSHTNLQALTGRFEVNRKKLEGLQIKKVYQHAQIEKLEENIQLLSANLKKAEQYLLHKQEELDRINTENKQQQTTIAELEQDQRQSAKLRLDYEEVCTQLKMLELDKKNMHNNHLELKKEYQQLHKQCEAIHFENLQTNERFNLLSAEKDKAQREIEQLELERHNHLNRLRAISKVINIAGPDAAVAIEN